MTGAVLPELATWTALRDELERGRPAVLVCVVASSGSSPGRPGWLMAVGREGRLAGTSGGGPGEQTAIATALDLLDAPSSARLLTQTHRPGAETASGMACGGEQRLALVPLDAESLPGLDRLIAALSAGGNAGWTVSESGWTAGAAEPDGFHLEKDGWRFGLVSGPSHEVFVVGAGHVGAALVPLLVRLAFRVTVVDERPGMALALDHVAHRVVESGYADLARLVPAGERTLVTITTHAPDRDAAAFEALREVPLGYLGLLGSRAKIVRLLGGRPRPPHLHAPMGLPIGSHTPEEIAVSIAAELVAWRAGRSHSDGVAQRPASPVS